MYYSETRNLFQVFDSKKTPYLCDLTTHQCFCWNFLYSTCTDGWLGRRLPATLKKTHFHIKTIYIFCFVHGIRAMFKTLGRERVGAAARMREEVKRRG